MAFEHVQKSYDGETLVVKDLNLAIGRGEFLTMLGPSGSGKTTCLMMLAGFETATHGEITLGGRPINSVPPEKRGIGMVFQNYALFPHMTVGENLAFPLQVRKMGKADIDAKVKRALDMVQMGAFASRRPAQLSGGQQQRIALARALVFEPELVLMDEPLGALDKQLREHMQFEIKHLHDRLGVTVVYVTHDQGEALTMSDRIAVFNDGRIQQLAPPEDLYERPGEPLRRELHRREQHARGQGRDASSAASAPCGCPRASCSTRCRSTSAGRASPRSCRSAPSGSSSSPSASPRARIPLEAEVLEFIYMGDIFRTRLRVAGNDDFVMKCRNSVGQRRLAAGERLQIGWLAQDCRALDAA